MSKVTLSFDEIVHKCTVSGGRNAVLSGNTLWYGNVVNLTNGELKITSFGRADEVKVVLKSTNITGVDAGTVLATLTPASPSFDGTAIIDGSPVTISSADYYLAVDEAHKGTTIEYDVTGAEITASAAAEGQDTVTDKDGVEYDVDATTNTTPIELNKGDKIKIVTPDSGGVSVLAYMYHGTYTGDAEVFPILSNTGYMAQTDEEKIKIVAGAQYHSGFSCEYNITRVYEDTQDTLVPGNELCYSASHFVTLEAGSSVTNNTSSKNLVVLAPNDKTILATLAKDESYEADAKVTVDLCGDDADTELSYTKNDANPKYACEYTGKSGVLSFIREKVGKIHFLIDAGVGYMEVDSTDAEKGMRQLSMAGIDKMMIVSDGAVTDCKINEY